MVFLFDVRKTSACLPISKMLLFQMETGGEKEYFEDAAQHPILAGPVGDGS
jgi:hypothetical protein